MAEERPEQGAAPPEPEKAERGVSPVYQTAFIVALLLLFVVVSKLYMDGYMEIAKLGAKRDAERKRYEENLATLAKLEGEIRLLKTDEGVEMVARDKLRFVRPDEVVVMPLAK